MNRINGRTKLFRPAALLLAGVLAACRTAANPPLSGELPPGYRGTAITVSAAEARMVHPKDRIDILTTVPVNSAEPNGPRTAETILQNVLVFRVGTISKDKGVLYVALNPNEAQYAVLEDLAAHFHITVRPKGDKDTHPMIKVEARKLFR
ncbi:MAG: RcpC/CpaB family pilus assembly protein [Patescibacteria group bacterium]